MAKLSNLHFNNTFSQLDSTFYTRVQPQGLTNPKLVSANKQAAQLIDLDFEQFQQPQMLEYFSGNLLLAGSDPLAMIYSGHQFGSYNPQLGDGRGLLLGEIDSVRHGKWDLHLKGAGLTPYSRSGDGRAVLRSSIREYLGSEAMAGLGIATTRALCLIGSETPVVRETVETGATLLRLARSHVRFGHFEYFHYNNRPQLVKQLADYIIDQHFPATKGSSTQYLDFLSSVVLRTAKLIASWQAVGFAHGVMNTDNMSILGDTFDYGPFAFLDDYNPGFICNHSDHSGRYAFNQQPSIGLWNLNALAHSLTSLLDKDQIQQALSLYEPALLSHYHQLLREKLGFTRQEDQDQQLVTSLLDFLQQEHYDYSYFFRQLCDFDIIDNNQLRDSFIDRQGFDNWAEQYRIRLRLESDNNTTRQLTMKKRNPKFILRNYLAQQAIDKANQFDYSEVDRLLLLLQSPFEEHTGFEAYSKPAPDWGKKLEISCSS